ncbi:uncharacterized protein LOC143267878 [Peromyscus maniculatus bairdii]|uniref:uncharacterized protein LOC143267878 n=1 Tax=Peromyscus maniculatus bairdii TaxID=230844 RepID=UPI003FD05DB3
MTAAGGRAVAAHEVTRSKEPDLPLISCCTQQNRPCTSLGNTVELTLAAAPVSARAGAQAGAGDGNAQADAQETMGCGNVQAGAQAASGYGAGAQAGPGMGSAGDCSPTGSGTTGEPQFGEGGSGGTAPLMIAKPLLPPASPSSSLYPVLPRKDSPKAPVLPPDPNSPLIDLLTEDPPPYPGNRAPEGPVAPAMAPEGPTAPPEAPEQPPRREREDEIPAPSPIAGRLRGKRDEPAKESRAFPLREGPNHQLQYWPFSASDLYNWKQHNPPFSKDPVALTNLIESILVTHKPTWEDCQQLLQTLLTVEEKQRVFLEARKRVPGDDGRPTQLPNIIDAAFPLTRPNWDFATPEDTFSGWMEIFPTKKETANVVTKKLLEEIFPSPTLEAHLQALQLVQKTVWKPLADAYREQLNRPVVPHPFKIGDSVWVRRHQSKNLEPRWKGPYTVLLTTPTALKVDGIAAWVHASHVKAAKEPDEAENTETSTWKVQRSSNPLKIRLTRGSP